MRAACLRIRFSGSTRTWRDSIIWMSSSARCAGAGAPSRVRRSLATRATHRLTWLTIDEPFFPGHFPHRPVMPGVMILEALAQVAGILAFVTAKVYPDENMQLYFVGIDKARFRQPVEPGDQIVLNAKLERALKGIWK